MKRIKQFLFIPFLLFVLICMNSIVVSAASVVDSGKCGSNVNWTLYSDNKLEISGSGAMDDYYEAPWYSSASSIQSITIDDGITKIGEKVFYNCTAIKSVVIPDSVVEIGDFAFSGCSSLNEVKLSDKLTSIGFGVFKECKNLTSIQIPNSVSNIGNKVFFGCTSLKSVELPNNITKIGWSAFEECSSLTNVVIPENVTEIGDRAFYSCMSLEEINIPKRVTVIGEKAFSVCQSLTSAVIPDGVTELNNHVFSFCEELKNIDIPNRVTRIGEYAFYKCNSLTEIELPDSVTEIGQDAFGFSENLKSVKLSKNLTVLGGAAFQNCDSLISMEIPAGVTKIGNYLFRDCENLKSVKLPDGIKRIGEYAFEKCYELEDVVIPKDVTEIDSRAFYNCDKLTNIVLPEDLDTIGDYVFYSCDSLTSITFLNSATEIEKYAFLGCKNIEDIYYAGTKDQWTALGEYVPSAKYIHYSSVNAENHWQLKTVAPTCTSVGYTFETCACSYERNKVEAGGMAGHDWSDWKVVKEATCTDSGKEERQCGSCGETESKVIVAKGHEPEIRNKKEASCTENGYTGDSVCKKCKALLETGSIIESKGHVWLPWETIKVPTYESDGIEKRTCDECKKTEEKIIPALFHTPELRNKKEATCTEDGYTGDLVCTKCEEVIEKGEVIKAAGHDWSEWNVVKEPTYDEDGVEARSCGNCGEKESRPVEKLEKPVIVNPFTDVSEEQYYYEAVLWAVGRGITNGTTPTTFSPDATCTRGQIVTFLWRAMGSQEPASANNPFADVPSNEYYYKAVLWAVENGVTTGTSAGKFSPDVTCTRDQVVTFLWRAMGKPEPTTTKNPFTDVEKDQYYYKPVLWAVEEGITTGTSATTFAPAKDCTRGQVVTFLYRAVG